MENLLIELDSFMVKADTLFSETDANATPFVIDGMEDAITKYFTQIASTLQHRKTVEMDEHKANLEGSFAFACDEHAQYHLGFAHGIAYALEILGCKTQ